LVGTTSVEHSERLSDRLRPEPVRRLMQTLIIRDAWLQKNNHQDDERAIPELQPLYKPIEELDVSGLRSMARPLEISLNPEEPANLSRLINILGLASSDSDRLATVLQAGVTHQVLNARKHDEESQIIARAGAFGAVTIATNMAGRGVDIKLGGELPEEILGDVNRVLSSNGHSEAYDMNNEERRAALLTLTPADYGIYEEQVAAFMKYIDDMKRVRELGGLHIIGSERHEARRIDNQLRGRSARQGDPGSSRFYLSLGDDLMRLFGGGQVENLLTRLNVDEALPIESGIVGRLVEQSQTRVEGSNFDVRKHLLEYDDVLNSQRARIYSQRDTIFTKENLSEDILDMLRTELQNRIPEALKDEEGPWKLLAYLEEIQPAIEYEDIIFPSFAQRLLLDSLNQKIESAPDPEMALRDALLDLAERSLQAEQDHLMRSAHEMIDKSEESLQNALDERNDSLDTFQDALRDQDEETGPRKGQDLMEELGTLIHLPVRLTPDQMRQLGVQPEPVIENIRAQVRTQLTNLTISRLIGSFEHRLEEPLNLKATQFQGADWADVSDQLIRSLEEIFEHRMQRLVGDQGLIAHDLDTTLAKSDGSQPTPGQIIHLLNVMAEGAKISFDRKTHRQTWQRTTRLRYIYLAARLLGERNPQDVTEDILEHLEGALANLEVIWGRSEWTRMVQTEATLSNLMERAHNLVTTALGEERFAALAETPLMEIQPDDRLTITSALGNRVLNEIYRQLLLSIISELWVDYLTQVEGLRVSIGLEAYAQRDPLVQYKSRATEMFQQLLSDIRAGVISRIFTVRPRSLGSSPTAAPVEEARPEAQPAEDSVPASPAQTEPRPQDGGKKRHRHH
jgi:preprotein translocase subunit SecA